MTGFRGIFTPLVTPLDETGSPDRESIRRLVRFQVDAGVHGLWAMGTSGEFASFGRRERGAAIEAVVLAAGRKVPVIANVSDASTRLVIENGMMAFAAGVDAIAATPPYYFPHSQSELLDHYRAIRTAVDLPLYMYNIPQTVRVAVDLRTAQRLAEEGVVAGIKDSQNDLEWLRQLIRFVRARQIPFAVFAGTRYLIDAAVLIGADGAIPSIANAFPDVCTAIYQATVDGDLNRASRLEGNIMDVEGLASSLEEGSRNAAVLGLLKALLYERGIISRPDLAAPLRTPSAEERKRVVGAANGMVAVAK